MERCGSGRLENEQNATLGGGSDIGFTPLPNATLQVGRSYRPRGGKGDFEHNDLNHHIVHYVLMVKGKMLQTADFLHVCHFRNYFPQIYIFEPLDLVPFSYGGGRKKKGTKHHVENDGSVERSGDT